MRLPGSDRIRAGTRSHPEADGQGSTNGQSTQWRCLGTSDSWRARSAPQGASATSDEVLPHASPSAQSPSQPSSLRRAAGSISGFEDPADGAVAPHGARGPPGGPRYTMTRAATTCVTGRWYACRTGTRGPLSRDPRPPAGGRVRFLDHGCQLERQLGLQRAPFERSARDRA